MPSNQVLHAALAIVKANGVTIGKMRGITVNENFNRAEVRGLGELTPQEVPAISWAGTLTADFYNIDYTKSTIPGAIRRDVQDTKSFVDNVLLNDVGVQVVLYKKVVGEVDPETGLITSAEDVYAVINGLFLDTDNFNINEGQVSGKNQSFRYLYPVIFPT